MTEQITLYHKSSLRERLEDSHVKNVVWKCNIVCFSVYDVCLALKDLVRCHASLDSPLEPFFFPTHNNTSKKLIYNVNLSAVQPHSIGLHVLFLLVWTFSGHSGFLTQCKNMHVSLFGDSTLLIEVRCRTKRRPSKMVENVYKMVPVIFLITCRQPQCKRYYNNCTEWDGLVWEELLLLLFLLFTFPIIYLPVWRKMWNYLLILFFTRILKSFF